MRKKFSATISAVIAAGLGIGTAIASDSSNSGWSSVPNYVSAYSGLAPESKTAIANAASTWNNAGSGNLVYKSSSDHDNTVYPNKNGANQITKGNTGLADHYDSASSEITMYGYSDPQETKKRTLEQADKDGILMLYPR
ncbi:hypothetical protein [Effusibacillus consociatus]|uniref:Uncharacterized protein n=1 Tax=Effusibacillus consociatus TaxID=1117041 RepID=A0ABV9Q7D1_9BACL